MQLLQYLRPDEIPGCLVFTNTLFYSHPFAFFTLGTRGTSAVTKDFLCVDDGVEEAFSGWI